MVSCHMILKIGFLLIIAALIDIDGNNWSSRFMMLLCTNSVVIKVCFCTKSIMFLDVCMSLQIYSNSSTRSRFID